MHRMMERFGVDRPLKTLPHHGEVTARAVERCGSCGHDGECAEWLDHNKQPEAPPEYCRNADLIERLRRVPTTIRNSDFLGRFGEARLGKAGAAALKPWRCTA